MSLTALDKPTPEQPARMYFGGREHLAIGLGRKLEDADAKGQKAIHEAVRRVIKNLVDAGAIERTTHAREGRRQVYRLLLDKTAGATPSVVLLTHAECGPETHTERGPETHTQRGLRAIPDVAPRRTEETKQEITQEPVGGGGLQPDPSPTPHEGEGRRQFAHLRKKSVRIPSA
ncbi:MAG TPA: hypothetical protein VIP06_02895 [Nocardioides sp.]